MEKNFKNLKTFEQHTDKNFNISDVINILSNDVAFEEAERNGLRIGDNGKLRRNSEYINAFEIGILHARKLLIDELHGNFNISDVINILSNDVAFKEAERKGSRIGDNGRLKRDSEYINAFEMGFLHARKLLIDDLG